ncbi:MAG TPA: hypothetical protein VKU01_20740 [Bryobacteraceae bacterium]|nr:hypothetical protein [Bryobacteraceae bacterium]
MGELSLPSNVHVDPNMHPSLYANLLLFAVVFDKTSLYAVSGNYFYHNCPLSFEHFLDLVRDPQESPFVLTAPLEWYDKDARKDRLNPLVTAWHPDYDDVVANKQHQYGVITVRTSPKIRDKAWTAALRYHDFVAGVLDDKDQDALSRKVAATYMAAQAQLISDRDGLHRRIKNHSDSTAVNLTFDGYLPAVFYHDQRHSTNYKDLLSTDDALSCLIFEHCTKPQIITQVEAATNMRFAMFVPANWHTLLLGSVGADSTAQLIREKRVSPSLEFLEELRYQLKRDEDYPAYLTEQLTTTFNTDFPRLAPRSADQALIDEVKEFRRHRGPAILREMLAESLSSIRHGTDPNDVMKLALKRLEDLRRYNRWGDILSRFILPEALLCGGYLFGTYLPEPFAVHTLGDTIPILTTAAALWKVDLIKRAIMRWSSKTGDEKFVLETLDRWASSGQPTNCVRTLGADITEQKE